MFDQMNIQFLVDDVGGVIICKEKIGCKKFNFGERLRSFGEYAREL